VKPKRVSIVQSKAETRTGRTDAAGRARIVDAARELFLTRGFVRVTADDIAAELGISKATLYKEFASKEEILRGVVRAFMAEISGRVDAIMKKDAQSFVERLVALFAFVGSRIAQFGPLFLRDIQKSAPDVWSEIEEFRRDKLVTNFKVILTAGHKEGLFRGDINDDLLLRMFLKLVEEFVNPTEVLRSGRSPAEIFESVIKVFFQGILTDKGRLDFSFRTPTLFEPRKEGAS
jgi:AcrR family transcriptional regulator